VQHPEVRIVLDHDRGPRVPDASVPDLAEGNDVPGRPARDLGDGGGSRDRAPGRSVALCVLTDVRARAYSHHPLEHTFDSFLDHWGRRDTGRRMTKRFDEEVRVERDAGMPSVFEWRGKRYQVVDVIGRWRIEGRWWSDGRDREYWRVEANGGAVWDLYHDRRGKRWHIGRRWGSSAS